MFNVLKDLLKNGGYTVAESFTIPSCNARYRPIPSFLLDSRLGQFLRNSEPCMAELWNHQSLALEKIGRTKNVVVSTSTASGKSLIFRVASFHEVMSNSDSRVLVLYPLKALLNDQLRGWRAMAEELDLDPAIVGRIDGSVAVADRDEILRKARIIVITPDVCHAWMMSRLSIPLVKTFLMKLTYMVIDEAHTFEGVFGSNFAFLLRRLLASRWHLLKGISEKPLRLIASTATIFNPANHMKILSGMEFESVDETDDGSPHAERFCAHVVCPVGEEMQVARTIQMELMKHSANGGFITFVDSRKGVEMLARSSQSDLKELIGNDAVMPYRAGYDSMDRENIERRLQAGNLRGVVSTSALELGIDLPHLAVGLNIGVPATRKTYRQRLGRVGRSTQGAFLIIGPQNAFKGYGTSFTEYHNMSVEPSYLYLDNRFMQFAHCRCLADELEALGARSGLPAHVQWPDGFNEVYVAAKPGGHRPPEFDGIAQLGGDSPQHCYPLRNVGELNFKIARGENAEGFGEASESQALRECYPGATYFHMGRPFEVISWNAGAFQPYIKVRPGSPGRHTKPRIRTWINTGIMPIDLMENHLLIGDSGFIAECQMQITEKVEGYTDQAGTFHSYQELRQQNPNMRSRQRNFRTSGVLLCIQDDWFKEKGVKQFLSNWISAIFCREYSILRQDVRSAATNISVRTMEGGGLRGDCLVLFDQTYGSLRLTERLFLNFMVIIQRLQISAESEEITERNILFDYIKGLESAYSGFKDYREYGVIFKDKVPPPNCIHVFTPGSVVNYREIGQIGTDVEVILPTWMNGQLMYQVKVTRSVPGSAPLKRWVSAQSIEASADADALNYGWWNAETEEFINPDEELQQ